jgi:FKBP-type peptidyl-prolyl cis-trans isomerase SlyD
MHMAQISDGKVVIMHYTLRDPAGEVIDSSQGDDPLAYLHGGHNIVPGLERELTGKDAGFKGIITVAPHDGYGERLDVPPQTVPRTAFPPQLPLEVGMQFTAQGPNNQVVPIWIVGADDERVLVESQHPLAGVTLQFEVEVLRVREATAEELEHGHPHGLEGHGGHHH